MYNIKSTFTQALATFVSLYLIDGKSFRLGV